MSYTDEVAEIMEKLLREFEAKYPDGNDEITNEDDLHVVASQFVNDKTFVESYHDVSKYVLDYNIRDSAEIRMYENDYRNLVYLFNDAFVDEAWDYLISNYTIPEENEENEE